MPDKLLFAADIEPVMSTREAVWLCGSIWLACVLFLCGATMADPDLWGHTLYGMRAIEQGVLAEGQDPFSYTAPGAEWINHEWLTEDIYGGLWNAAGSAGLVLWRNCLVSLLFIVLAASLTHPGVRLGGAILLLVFTTECLANFVLFVRPQLATFTLFAFVLLMFRRYWDSPTRAVWWCVPVMALWTNLHGGFLAGLAIAGLVAAAAILRGVQEPLQRRAASELSAVVVAMAMATFVNPYGARLHFMLWDHLVTDQCVREWQPIWETGRSIVYYIPFAITGIVLFRSRRWQWIDLAILAAVAWQAASHLRHVALLSIAMCILLAVPASDAIQTTFSQICSQWSRRSMRPWRMVAAIVLILVLCTLQLRGSRGMWKHGIAPWQIAVETRSGVPGVPVRAMLAMKEMGLKGNLITDYGWGQFALWHLYPEFRIAFDGRYRTVFPAELERDFLAFQRMDDATGGTTPLLDNYETQVALVPVESRPDRYLKSRSDWSCVYRDDQAAVYVIDELAISREQPSLPAVPDVPHWITFPAGRGDGTRLALRNCAFPTNPMYASRTQ